jgi:hypothetical protein
MEKTIAFIKYLFEIDSLINVPAFGRVAKLNLADCKVNNEFPHMM